VKNRCFLVLSYDDVMPSPRNAEAVMAIARSLHVSGTLWHEQSPARELPAVRTHQ
jgi:hypothetical protein